MLTITIGRLAIASVSGGIWKNRSKIFMRKQFDIVFHGAIVLAAVIVSAGTYLGFSRWFGAHPFWQVQVVWIGIAVAAALFLGLFLILQVTGKRLGK